MKNQRSNREKEKRPSHLNLQQKGLKTSEAVEILLKYIEEFKTNCEFNGVDFRADLSTMYAEICRCMAVDFTKDFAVTL